MGDYEKSALSVSRPTSFQFKGGLLPMSILEIKSTDIGLITKELTAKVKSSPGFFEGSPVVFSFEHIGHQADTNLLNTLCTLSKELGLISCGIKGGGDEVSSRAKQLELATFSSGKAKKNLNSPTESNTAVIQKDQNVQKTNSAPSSSNNNTLPAYIPTKIIESPVRSGQQVYAPGDLVIMSSVSAGAEILAQGNIHVYGALRGRALAGIEGLESARIFCLSQQAELISIAGHFMIDEELRAAHWAKPAQVFYDGDDIQVKILDRRE